MAIPKITQQVRRLLTDPDYYHAMQMLLSAQDALRMIEQRNRPPSRCRYETEIETIALRRVRD